MSLNDCLEVCFSKFKSTRRMATLFGVLAIVALFAGMTMTGVMAVLFFLAFYYESHLWKLQGQEFLAKFEERERRREPWGQA